MWNQIMRDGSKSYFEELSSIESESVTNKANDNTYIAARHILAEDVERIFQVLCISSTCTD